MPVTGPSDKAVNVIILFVLIIIAIPVICISLTAFKIGGDHQNTTCDNGTFWALSSWLRMTNSILFIHFVGNVVVFSVIAFGLF